MVAKEKYYIVNVRWTKHRSFTTQFCIGKEVSRGTAYAYQCDAVPRRRPLRNAWVRTVVRGHRWTHRHVARDHQRTSCNTARKPDLESLLHFGQQRILRALPGWQPDRDRGAWQQPAQQHPEHRGRVHTCGRQRESGVHHPRSLPEPGEWRIRRRGDRRLRQGTPCVQGIMVRSRHRKAGHTRSAHQGALRP